MPCLRQQQQQQQPLHEPSKASSAMEVSFGVMCCCCVAAVAGCGLARGTGMLSDFCVLWRGPQHLWQARFSCWDSAAAEFALCAAAAFEVQLLL